MLNKIMKSRGLTALFGRTFSQEALPEAAHRFNQTYSKARNIMRIYELRPLYATNHFFIAPNATVVGEVYICNTVAIMDNAVIRGDLNSVLETLIGEGCVLHTCASVPSGISAELYVGQRVIVQPGCTLYSCTINNNVLIGHNSVIMEGCIIEQGAVIAPGSVVPPGRLVPANQTWGGNPIKFIKENQGKILKTTMQLAQVFTKQSMKSENEFLGYSNSFLLKPNEPAKQPEEALGLTGEDWPSSQFYKDFC